MESQQAKRLKRSLSGAYLLSALKQLFGHCEKLGRYLVHLAVALQFEAVLQYDLNLLVERLPRRFVHLFGQVMHWVDQESLVSGRTKFTTDRPVTGSLQEITGV